MKNVFLALALLATPAFARAKAPAAATKADKPPHAGAFCAKGASGTTLMDSKGTALECKADKKGKLRWSKK